MLTNSCASAVGEHFVEGALAHEPARRHHSDVRCDLLDLAEQMARHQHGRAVGGEIADELAHLAGALRIKPVRRLVEDQQVTGLQQRGSKTEPLLHAERVVAVLLAGGRRKPDARECRVDARPRRRGVGRRIAHVQTAQILQPGEIGMKRGAFDQRTDTWQHPRAVTRHRRPEQFYLAGVRSDEPEQHADRSRLARSVGSEEAVDGTVWNVQIDGVDGHLRTESTGQSRRAHRDGHGRAQ